MGTKTEKVLKIIKLKKKLIKFQDVSGLQRYRMLFQLYYRQADVAIVLYDVTKDSSYSHAQLILEELKEKVNPTNNFELLYNLLCKIYNDLFLIRLHQT